MYIVLLGAPGSGKGTQAMLLTRALGLAHISTGDLFRRTAASGSPLGREVAAIMASGGLVSDDLTLQVAMERMRQPDCARGAILDGFPRNLTQGQGLDEALREEGKAVTRAVYIHVPDDVLVDRLSDRWLSRLTGESFNPKTLGQSLDDIRKKLPPGDELYQRPDDSPEAARRRVQVYNEQTVPLIEHFRAEGVLRTVDGNRGVEAVHRDIIAAIES